MIIVLGMHRSGTSSLTGLLEACGYSPGNVPDVSRGNAKGNREAQTIRRINNQLLDSVGGSWRSPVPVTTAPQSLRETMQSALQELRTTTSKLVLKDPRFLFTLEAWQNLFGEYRIVGSYRHPEPVARSLNARNRMSSAEASHLWCQYNTELVQRHRRAPFPLVSFDLAGKPYLKQFERLAAQMSLELDSRLATAFYDSSLVNHVDTDMPATEPLRSIYDYLHNNRVTS